MALALASGHHALYPARAASIRPECGRLEGTDCHVTWEEYIHHYAETHTRKLLITDWIFLLDLRCGSARALHLRLLQQQR